MAKEDSPTKDPASDELLAKNKVAALAQLAKAAAWFEAQPACPWLLVGTVVTSVGPRWVTCKLIGITDEELAEALRLVLEGVQQGEIEKERSKSDG